MLLYPVLKILIATLQLYLLTAYFEGIMGNEISFLKFFRCKNVRDAKHYTLVSILQTFGSESEI